MKNVCYKCGSTNHVRETKSKYVRKSGEVTTYSTYKCKKCSDEFAKKHYDRCKAIVFDHYGGLCVCCGEKTQEFLTIDHVNNDGHSEVYQSNGRRITGIQLYARIVKARFPLKYQLMCMNCNFGKRMNGGICPHEV